MEKHRQKIKDQFSRRISTYEKAAKWMLDPALLKAHVNLLNKHVTSGRNCMDLCCGTGIMGRTLRRNGWHVHGVDLTPEMTEEARKHVPALCGSIEHMPDFPDNSFDAAVLRQSFMLVDGPRALAEIHRILKPGGIFVLSQSVAFGKDDEPQYQKIQAKRHINMLSYYTAEGLEQMVEKDGSFSIEEKCFLRIRESASHWMKNALALSQETKKEILDLIQNAPEGYKKARHVSVENGVVHEDWNWLILAARARK